MPIKIVREPISREELKKICRGKAVKIIFHKELATGKWFKLSLMEQLANIGSEVSRASLWQGKDEKLFQGAIYRALELFDLTLDDPRWRGRRGEIARLREIFCDAVFGGKEYKSSLKDLVRYFNPFAYAARIGHD